ncbi:hypothetical protein G6F32_017235 [Rhizopus arrhizus]|nr:hypothetical protein G6F32_017235 [Rhizopus arrhizus]
MQWHRPTRYGCPNATIFTSPQRQLPVNRSMLCLLSKPKGPSLTASGLRESGWTTSSPLKVFAKPNGLWSRLTNGIADGCVPAGPFCRQSIAPTCADFCT